MTRRFCRYACVFGVLAVSAGCASSRPATATTAEVSSTRYLGAGDSVGWAISANHDAIMRTARQTDASRTAAADADH